MAKRNRGIVPYLTVPYLTFIFSVTVLGQSPIVGVGARGLTPKASVQEYEKSVAHDKLSLGVNYMGRSFEVETSGPNSTVRRVLLDAGKFLVLELALFPAKGHEPKVSIGDFQLFADGKKIPYTPATPGMVAAYLRYPDWDQSRPRLEAGGGVGNAGIVLGRPQSVPRFPGDPRPGQTQVPNPGRVTTEDSPDAAQAALESALPEGPLTAPRAGNLYFEIPQKLSKVKSLLLVYEKQQIRLELKLR